MDSLTQGTCLEPISPLLNASLRTWGRAGEANLAGRVPSEPGGHVEGSTIPNNHRLNNCVYYHPKMVQFLGITDIPELRNSLLASLMVSDMIRNINVTQSLSMFIYVSHIFISICKYANTHTHGEYIYIYTRNIFNNTLTPHTHTHTQIYIYIYT